MKIPHQEPTDIYLNQGGDLVIKQLSREGEDMVLISAGNIGILIKIVQSLKKNGNPPDDEELA